MNQSWNVIAWVRTVLRVVGSIIVLVLWYMPTSVALLHWPVRVTVAAALLTSFCAVYWYALRKPRATERFGALPLAPLRSSACWVAGLALATPLAVAGAGALFILLGYPLANAPDPLAPFLHRPGGWLAVSAVALLVAPVLEEFAFRGWIQTPLEQQLGAPGAILITALLFAALHMEPLQTPFLFFDGVVLGVAVYLTRSIWAGVAIHFGINLLAMLSEVPRVAAVLDLAGPARWWKVLSFLLLITIAFFFLLRGLRRATRSTRSPSPVAQPSAPFVPADLVR